MHSIDVTLRIKIADGPEIKEATSQAVQAYSEVVFEIKGKEEKCVEVQPSEAEKIVFLLIKSSLYSDKEDSTKEILYGIDITTDPEINLDQPHLYQGPGGVSVLGGDPKSFKFKNTFPSGTTEEEKKQNTAKIQILVGRKAVIDCP